jgi:hypothetical protein
MGSESVHRGLIRINATEPMTYLVAIAVAFVRPGRARAPDDTELRPGYGTNVIM